MAIQELRSFEVNTPLGPDTLLFRRMTAMEQIGRMFQFDLELLSEDNSIKLSDMLGQNVSVRIDLPDGEERFFNGFCSRFTQAGLHRNFWRYRATLRPWLWFLTRTSDCRIYQEMKVPDIIKDVFSRHGFTDIEDNLTGSYRTWNYIVQYRETSFNFISRLMEQEGFYYYFKHEKDKHYLVLADGNPEPISGYETLPYFPPENSDRRERDHVYDFNMSQEVQPGKYVMRDYNMLTPSSTLQVERNQPKSHDNAENEIYDYPGEYPVAGDGDDYVRARLEELHAQHEIGQGQGNARGLSAGFSYTLEDYPRDDQNIEYLLTQVVHEMQSNMYETDGDDGTHYSNSFHCIPASVPYRLPRTTPKPIVQGPQTAVVVGPAGEEIFTDEHARVKVHFFWHRHDQEDENAGCWIRVASIWAGQNWGGIHIPRIGQEVIVEFLEGDPDRPIITGRVYNASQPPPYDLPTNKTQSGIKSRSSLGGTPDNFNEIRFEDKIGEEEMYIHAEKDQNTVVENDQGIEVGRDRKEEIGRDRSLLVGRDKSETIKRDKAIKVEGDHGEGIKGAMTINVGGTLTETVAKKYTETVNDSMELNVDKVMTVTVGDNYAQTVSKDSSEDVSGNKDSKIGKDLNEAVQGKATVEISKDLSETIGGKHDTSVTKESSVNAKKIQLVAKDEITLKTGSASIVLKKNGDITIKGKKINIKGSGDVVIKGSQIKEN
jgi:type VI secretion system secreted protein VgrG